MTRRDEEEGRGQTGREGDRGEREGRKGDRGEMRGRGNGMMKGVGMERGGK